MGERWYKHWLEEAVGFERIGCIAKAINALDRAKPHTCDEDELTHLEIWRKRLAVKLHETASTEGKP